MLAWIAEHVGPYAAAGFAIFGSLLALMRTQKQTKLAIAQRETEQTRVEAAETERDTAKIVHETELLARVSKLETRNDDCEQRNDACDQRATALEAQNETQAEAISELQLMVARMSDRPIKHRVTPAAFPAVTEIKDKDRWDPEDD